MDGLTDGKIIVHVYRLTHSTLYRWIAVLSINPLSDGGGTECPPPLAKSAPVQQGLTFEWP